MRTAIANQAWSVCSDLISKLFPAAAVANLTNLPTIATGGPLQIISGLWGTAVILRAPFRFKHAMGIVIRTMIVSET